MTYIGIFELQGYHWKLKCHTVFYIINTYFYILFNNNKKYKIKKHIKINTIRVYRAGEPESESEPEPVGAGCFLFLGAGAAWKKQEPEPLGKKVKSRSRSR